MADNNAKIAITGNLVRDPELKKVNERSLLSFTVAVNTDTKREDGTYDSNFYDCSYWGVPGEWAAEKLQKGTNVTVFGDFNQYEYVGKDNEKKYRLRVRVFEGKSSVIVNARGKERPAANNGYTAKAAKPAAKKTYQKAAPAQQEAEGDDLF